ncbi:MAG: metallophosphoesterase [Woeseiaceae bacterium]
MVFPAVLLLCSACATAADWRWQGVERVVAISDVHGAYPAMVQTLRNAAVLDREDRWSGGAAHLVITGDILDRGPDSRRVMDLLMRLEGEAAAAGGQVHLLLGNHEVMNLVGDLRYVSAAEYSAFADEEPAGERERAFAAFKASQTGTTDEAALQSAFDQRAPPGYFGHRRAFAPDGQYGQWLLEKPFIVVINDTAFVHGGLSPAVREKGLDGVNGEMKDQLAAYTGFLQTLIGAGILDATDNFYHRAELLGTLPEQPERPAEIQEAIDGAIDLHAAAIHDLDSPVWYRGNVACSALIESDKLDAVLERIGAARVVIGHTPTATGNVQTRLDGRVIEIDTGMLASAYGGSGHALVIEGDELRVVAEKSDESSTPVPQPRVVGENTSLPVAELEDILGTGDITSMMVDEADRHIVEFRSGATRMTARFAEPPGGRGFRPEVAAYRLDRLLGLDMIPVTAPREIEGEPGSLQLLPGRTENEATRQASGEGAAAWCPLPEQWQALYVFDTLIGNAGRRPEDMLYNPDNWQLMLTGHENAFSTRDGRPAYLERVELKLGDAWVGALTSLSDEVLEEKLGDVLDSRRLRALGKRRDELLETAEEQRRVARSPHTVRFRSPWPPEQYVPPPETQAP